MSLLVRQTAGADERTGSARQQPRRSLCRQSIGRDVRSVLALVFADITPARKTRPVEVAAWAARKPERVTVGTRRRAKAKERAFAWPKRRAIH